jgi:hypothetical protein
MLHLKVRLNKLENVLIPVQGPSKRWVVVIVGAGPANLANSRCTRTRSQGRLWEVVHLDGHGDDLSDEQIQRFVETFPIQEGR